MNPKPFSSLNHFTVPVAISVPPCGCTANAEGARRQRLRKRGALLRSNGCSTRASSLAAPAASPLAVHKLRRLHRAIRPGLPLRDGTERMGSAVDVDQLAGDLLRPIGEQEADGPGDWGRVVRVPAERGLCRPARGELVEAFDPAGGG